MIKKIIAGTVLSAMTLFALPNSELELLIVSKAVEKKAIVLSNMGLKGTTKQKFGTLYDMYQEELMIQRMAELNLIGNYALNHKNMTDKTSDLLMIEWLSLEAAALQLKKEYMVKFKEVMPSADVIRYFQIENRLQLLREVERSSLIPLAMPAETVK